MNHGSDKRDSSGVARAVLIAGPTASGKSALALALAERLGGMVINADSMQVYRDLRIITARPTSAEEARLPHRLYGHVDAAETYSVGRWLTDTEQALAEAAQTARIPLVVGGTGLYFKSLTQGLASVPPIPPAIRTALRERLAREGAVALHAELARKDPQTASRIGIGDGVRIVRALEVLASTGRNLSYWHGTGMRPLVDPAGAIKIFLAPERAELYRRIDVRFDAMIENGALQEVRALCARGLDPLLPAMKAHGVPWLRRAMAGDMRLYDAIIEAKRDTRRYTKRQFTWFRHQLPDWTWYPPEAAETAVLQGLEAFRA